MDKLQILLTAFITAIGTASGAFIFSLFQKLHKKRDEKILERLDVMTECQNLLMRYSLHQSNVLSTMLDAIKTNHVNGNVERAEKTLEMANTELNSGLQKAIINKDKKS